MVPKIKPKIWTIIKKNNIQFYEKCFHCRKYGNTISQCKNNGKGEKLEKTEKALDDRKDNFSYALW